MESKEENNRDDSAIELIKVSHAGHVVHRSDLSDEFYVRSKFRGLGINVNGDILIYGNREQPTDIYLNKRNGSTGSKIWEIRPFINAFEDFSIRSSERSLALLDDGTALVVAAGYFYPSQQGTQNVSNYIAKVDTSNGTVLDLHKVDHDHYTKNSYGNHRFIKEAENWQLQTIKGVYLITNTGKPLTCNFAENINSKPLAPDGVHSPGSASAYAFNSSYSYDLLFNISGKNKFHDEIHGAHAQHNADNAKIDIHLTDEDKGDAFFLHYTFNNLTRLGTSIQASKTTYRMFKVFARSLPAKEMT